jgi:hypothetical protein
MDNANPLAPSATVNKGLEGLAISCYISVACLTFVLWHHLTSLEDERKMLWRKQRWSTTNMLYMAVSRRYNGLEHFHKVLLAEPHDHSNRDYVGILSPLSYKFELISMGV